MSDRVARRKEILLSNVTSAVDIETEISQERFGNTFGEVHGMLGALLCEIEEAENEMYKIKEYFLELQRNTKDENVYHLNAFAIRGAAKACACECVQVASVADRWLKYVSKKSEVENEKDV